MEIDKILFGQLSAGKVDKSFEDLDINSDGKISEEDLSLTQDNEISNALNAVLHSVDQDEDVEILDNFNFEDIKTSSTNSNNGTKETNDFGILTTSTKDFTEDVLKSKGTVYVLIGNDDCGPCMNTESAIQKNKSAIEKVAQIYSLSAKDNTELSLKICKEMGNCKNSVRGGIPLPQIAKFVDGKFIQMIPNTHFSEVADELIKFAKGTAVKDIDGVPQTSANSFKEDVLNSKGTTYVTITGNSCGYCNWLHHQVKKGADEIFGKIGYYELNAEASKENSDLSWQIYRDMAKQDATPMQLPQIAKFVDGKFVGLVSATRDSGGKYPDNATIKEMLAEAEGTPSNNALGNNSSTQIVNDINSFKTNSSQNLFTTNSPLNKTRAKAPSFNDSLTIQLQKLQNELEEILEDKEKKEKEYETTKRELEKLQSEYDEAMKKAENGENMEFELTNLKLKINNLSSLLDSLKIDIERLTTQYNTKSLEIESQKQIVNNKTEELNKVEGIISLTQTSYSSSNTVSNVFSGISKHTPEDSTDWNALFIDGKGVNINNFVNVLDLSGDKKVTKTEISKLYKTGTDEQRTVLEKFFDFDNNGVLKSSSTYLNYFTYLVKEKSTYNPLFEALAFQDSDGDGFLSDDEISEIKSKIEYQSSMQAMYKGNKVDTGLRPKTNCMLIKNGVGQNVQLSNSAYAFTQTTVNGKKVYIGFTAARSQYLSITEDEMNILNEYMKPENVKRYIGSDPNQLDPIWKALGAKEVKPGQTITLTNGQEYTNSNSSRPTQVFLNSAGEICSYMINENCSQCGKSFYALYLGIRDMMEGKEVQFRRDSSDMWL